MLCMTRAVAPRLPATCGLTSTTRQLWRDMPSSSPLVYVSHSPIAARAKCKQEQEQRLLLAIAAYPFERQILNALQIEFAAAEHRNLRHQEEIALARQTEVWQPATGQLLA